MDQAYHRLVNELKRSNIRLSSRRLKILEYLCRDLTHPTVEQIYGSLKTQVPGLSKTTVYNTLHILVKAGLVKELYIEDNEIRYDIVTKSHGHFKCEKCGAIYNFEIDPGALATQDLKGFKVIDKDVYFKGVCPKCIEMQNNA